MTKVSSTRLEYALIVAAPGIGIDVTPVTPDIEPIGQEATAQGLALTINRLAELGYRLIDGTVLRTDVGKPDGAFFMYRERGDG